MAFVGFVWFENVDPKGVEELSGYMNAFVPFVLGPDLYAPEASAR